MIDHYALPPDKLQKAIALDHTYKIIGLGDLAFMLLLLVLMLELGGWRWLRDRLPARFQGLVFFTTIVSALTLSSLPFGIWAHHVSLAYGLSVQGWASWFGDRGKSLLLVLVVAVPLLLGVRELLRRTPRRAWLWIAVAAVPVQLVLVFASPYVIDPLFERFEPLATGHAALVAKLSRVIDKSGESIPPSRMFLMKASDKHTTLNAYVTGFGASKRVVVWDTTADQRPDDEVLFVFGHELGHYALGHVVRGIVIGCLGGFVLLFIVQRLVLLLARRYRIERLDDLAAFGLYALVLAVLGLAGEPIGNALSRAQEHDADIYGQEVIHGLVSDPQQTAAHAFQALGEQSLDRPDPSALWVWWSYSHPSISERVRFAAQYDPWARGTPRYFQARSADDHGGRGP
ncbi:MAG: M48 family metalloprotease [Polyangia bacterium]